MTDLQHEQLSDPWAMNPAGKIIRDAWVFGLLSEGEGLPNRDVKALQALEQSVMARWAEYGNCVNCLPREMRECYTRIHAEAIRRARIKGWLPEEND